MSERIKVVSAGLLASRLGVSRRQVQRWSADGVIRPSAHGQGSGRAMLFLEAEVSAVLAERGWRGNQKARRRAEDGTDSRTCSKCERVLPLDEFPPSTGKTCGWHCRCCRTEQKREARRRLAEATGKPYSNRAEAKRAREQRAFDRRMARAVCLAFHALVRPSPEERRLKATADSVRWQRERYNADPDYQAKVKAKKIRRKRARRGTQVVPVNRERVAERDAWRCGLCGGEVNRETWSLDHIEPLSRGGEHTYENVQLAHLSCNSRKGNRVTAPRCEF